MKSIEIQTDALSQGIKVRFVVSIVCNGDEMHSDKIEFELTAPPSITLEDIGDRATQEFRRRYPDK